MVTIFFMTINNVLTNVTALTILLTLSSRMCSVFSAAEVTLYPLVMLTSDTWEPLRPIVLMLRRLLSSYWVPRVGMEMLGWPSVISLSRAAIDFLLLRRMTRKRTRPITARSSPEMTRIRIVVLLHFFFII